MKKGTHSPFDSDSCLAWGIYCMNTGHDPDKPIEIIETEFIKGLNNAHLTTDGQNKPLNILDLDDTAEIQVNN